MEDLPKRLPRPPNVQSTSGFGPNWGQTPFGWGGAAKCGHASITLAITRHGSISLAQGVDVLFLGRRNMHPVNEELLSDLAVTLAEHGFRKVSDGGGIPEAMLILKRQTWNTNRAVVVLCPAHSPADIRAYLREVRRRVAFRCGFVPLFWGIGIQVVMISPGIAQSGIEPAKHVARVDNQWAIIQSIFVVDPCTRSYCGARSWGQFVTGKFQDAIDMTLSRYFSASFAG